jgi:ribonuclease Y
VTRLSDLEKLAEGIAGVQKAYAIQAGKELRVLVENATVSDEQSVVLAKDIAKRIEDEASYPGTVRVCVIRETRSTDYAR